MHTTCEIGTTQYSGYRASMCVSDFCSFFSVSKSKAGVYNTIGITLDASIKVPRLDSHGAKDFKSYLAIVINIRYIISIVYARDARIVPTRVAPAGTGAGINPL